MLRYSAVHRNEVLVHNRDRAARPDVDRLKFLPQAPALKCDGRVLFSSFAGCHGDGSGAQQTVEAASGSVAPVLRMGLGHLRPPQDD